MTNYTISSDTRRALTGPGFLVAMAGMVLTIGLASLEGIITLARSGAAPAYGAHARLVAEALSSDWVTLALPVLCALPYASAYVDDVKSGYVKQYLHRSGIHQYIKGKLVGCALSGGLAVSGGVMLAWLLAALLLTPMELAPAPGAARPYFAEMLMKAAVLFFSGAFWSLTGFTAAALTMNKFVAYASPFILYYVLIILHERYFEELYVLYPKEWLAPSDPSGLWVLGTWGIILFLMELIAIVGLVFALTAKRRLSNV